MSLLGVIFILTSCNGKQNSIENAQTQTSNRVIQNILQSEIKDIATGVIWRVSDVKDESGIDQPPWTKVAATNISFDRPVKAGDKVTVIPAEASVSSINLKIISVDEREMDKNENEVIKDWSVELEEITAKEYYDANSTSADTRPDVPFHICVLYPAVDYAQAINKADLDISHLPRGESIDHIMCAIDTTRNGKANIIVIEAPIESNPEYTATRYYVNENDKWRLLKETLPM